MNNIIPAILILTFSLSLFAEEESPALSCEEYQYIMMQQYGDKTIDCGNRKEPPKKKQISSNCKCDEFDNFNCKYILDGYEEGSFKHDKAKKFTLTILSEIELFDESKVYNIQIKGVADGIPNNGISDWRNIIKKCKKRNKGRINDKHLAVLRACYIIDELDNTNLPSLLTWKNKDVDVTFHDHPDGINQGSKYRKTEFYYSVLGHCDGT